MITPKQTFLLEQALQSSIIASLQRTSVYSPQANVLGKKFLTMTIRSNLQEIVKQYSVLVPEEEHVQNIIRLSIAVSTKCGSTLLNGRFRIGNAQKALNLYLKYLWCLDQIPTPPHCPFDSRIIAKLPSRVQIPWTRIDDINIYISLVDAAKLVAAGLSLAEWELLNYPGA
jgi:hypothetical protein